MMCCMRMTESDSHFCTTLMSDREEPLETNWRVIESGMDDEAHTHTPHLKQFYCRLNTSKNKSPMCTSTSGISLWLHLFLCRTQESIFAPHSYLYVWKKNSLLCQWCNFNHSLISKVETFSHRLTHLQLWLNLCLNGNSFQNTSVAD